MVVVFVIVRGAKARPFGANVQLDDERVRVRLGYIGVGLMYFIIKVRFFFYMILLFISTMYVCVFVCRYIEELCLWICTYVY